MTSKKNRLQPGFLVVGNISQRGCVSYSQTNRKGTKEGQRLEEDWEGHKICKSVDEQKLVSTTRSQLGTKISRLGTYISGFGYLIKREKAQELENAIREVEEAVNTFNSTAQFTRLDCRFAVFEVQATDEKVANALYSKTVDLLSQASRAIKNSDVKRLREVLFEMQGIDTLLPESTGQRISKTIKAARDAAKRACKEIKKAALEGSAQAIDFVSAMKVADVDGLRADLIEETKQIRQEVGCESYLPDVDSRQVEIEFAEITTEDQLSRRSEAAKKAAATKKAQAQEEKKDIEAA